MSSHFKFNWSQFKFLNLILNCIKKKNRGTSSIQLNFLIHQLTVYPHYLTGRFPNYPTVWYPHYPTVWYPNYPTVWFPHYLPGNEAGIHTFLLVGIHFLQPSIFTLSYRLHGTPFHPTVQSDLPHSPTGWYPLCSNRSYNLIPPFRPYPLLLLWIPTGPLHNSFPSLEKFSLGEGK